MRHWTGTNFENIEIEKKLFNSADTKLQENKKHLLKKNMFFSFIKLKMNCIVVYLIILIKLSKSLENEETTWSHFYGNPSNTRRIIPSLSTNYTGQSWIYKYISSAQDIATQGT
jgi:hypothetical protein